MALFQYEKHAQTVTYQALSLHNENKRYVSLQSNKIYVCKLFESCSGCSYQMDFFISFTITVISWGKLNTYSRYVPAILGT